MNRSYKLVKAGGPCSVCYPAIHSQQHQRATLTEETIPGSIGKPFIDDGFPIMDGVPQCELLLLGPTKSKRKQLPIFIVLAEVLDCYTVCFY